MKILEAFVPLVEEELRKGRPDDFKSDRYEFKIEVNDEVLKVFMCDKLMPIRHKPIESFKIYCEDTGKVLKDRRGIKSYKVSNSWGHSSRIIHSNLDNFHQQAKIILELERMDWKVADRVELAISKWDNEDKSNKMTKNLQKILPEFRVTKSHYGAWVAEPETDSEIGQFIEKTGGRFKVKLSYNEDTGKFLILNVMFELGRWDQGLEGAQEMVQGLVYSIMCTKMVEIMKGTTRMRWPSTIDIPVGWKKYKSVKTPVGRIIIPKSAEIKDEYFEIEWKEE